MNRQLVQGRQEEGWEQYGAGGTGTETSGRGPDVPVLAAGSSDKQEDLKTLSFSNRDARVTWCAQALSTWPSAETGSGTKAAGCGPGKPKELCPLTAPTC